MVPRVARHHWRMPTTKDAYRAIDERIARFRDDRRVPGVAWGLIRDGALVHTGGLGEAVVGEPRPPDAETVFRIASMTKSFTAALILGLRDEGRLDLDDPVARHVPELAGWRPPNADARPVTIRQLLTMSAGLATDDPWGDRQQGLLLDAFARLLAAGPSFAWPPGTMFEYSNLGFGILGRVATSAGGAEYRDLVTTRLLVPLGMTSSGFREEDVPVERLARGYVRRDDAFVREGDDPYGAFASMGGLYSTVRDLSRWVAGFLDAFPARSDPEGPHPLSRASRREMQQVQRSSGVAIPAHAPDAVPDLVAGGYGIGLFVASHPDLGTFVTHSGGYPGYGSEMAWHPASGLGMVVLANLRYAGPMPVVAELLTGLVRDGHAPRRRPAPAPATGRLRRAAEALIDEWDDAGADLVFAMNMDLDEPRDLRRAAIQAAVEAIGGPLRGDPDRQEQVASAAQVEWWLRGLHGWLRIRLLATPEPEPRIQALRIAAVGDPSPALVTAGEQLLDACAADTEAGRLPRWPAGLGHTEALDTVAVGRALTAGWTRFGRLRLGRPVDGDGRTSTTWALLTERGGAATLRIALDPESGAVAECALQVARRESPAGSW